MNNLYKVVEYTAFGKTKKVRAELYNMTPDEEPQEYLWVERGEDYYALMSSQLKNKRVAIITRNEWLKN
jgi:hypothetical protein